MLGDLCSGVLRRTSLPLGVPGALCNRQRHRLLCSSCLRNLHCYAHTAVRCSACRTCLAVAGADYCIVGASTRMSTGYSILTRRSSKILQL
jgi:hypothetical protein